MIRQAISCDICAAEKRQTNHWFVAYEQAGELRVSGWTSRHKLRPESKHLCGQTCLHKLVDEFMAKSIAVRAQRRGEVVEAVEAEASPLVLTDTSLAIVAETRAAGARAAAARAAAARVAEAEAALAAEAEEVESSARLITTPAPVPAKPVYHPLPELVKMPSRPQLQDFPPLPADTLRYASRRWHAEAWEREREREMRATENHPDVAARRRTSA
jgi:hypothetical protein